MLHDSGGFGDTHLGAKRNELERVSLKEIRYILESSKRLTLPFSSNSAIASVARPRRSACRLHSLMKLRNTAPSSSPFAMLIVPNLSDDCFKKCPKVDKLKVRTQGVLMKGQKERK